MATTLRLGFAATPAFALPALTALQESGCTPVVVYTQPDRPAGRGRKPRASPIKEFAQRHDIRVEQPASLRTPQALQTLCELQLDLLIVVAYGLLLPPAVLTTPRLGCINIHASLLPRWRGAAPIQRAILAGDEQTGISLMQMDQGLDTGPVYEQTPCAIPANYSAGDLHDQLASLGAQSLLRWLDALSGTSTSPTAQTALNGEPTYASKIDKAEAELDWRLGADQLHRQIRAFNPWPVAFTGFLDKNDNYQRLRIIDATIHRSANPSTELPGTIIEQTDAAVIVACGEGELAITTLQLAGRKATTAAQFNHAHRLSGIRLSHP